MAARRTPFSLFLVAALMVPRGLALAQPAAAPPPAVGVARAEERPVTESSEFVGRVTAPDKVDIIARVPAFVDARYFTEGAEVKVGEPLYRLERVGFAALVAQQEAAVALAEARLQQADQALGRAQALMGTPAGLKSSLDDAKANQGAAAATLSSARALLDAARINLGYTEVTAPFAGRIGRSNVSVGAAVGPATGPLVSIVSQDPMQVTFPVAVKSFLELQRRYADKGGLSAVRVRLNLTDGSPYDEAGTIDFTAPSVSGGTDTLQLRAVFPNPKRRLIDGAFVSVRVEGIEPVQALTIPRQAVLADVRGNYVWTVGAENKVERRDVKLGNSSIETAVILEGLRPGEMVIVDGMQRARPGIVVNPAPAAPPPAPAGGSAPASSGGR